MNLQMIEGKWKQLKGRIRNQWGQITDDEWTAAEGSVEQLLGLIQEKTGEARGVIEKQLSRLAGDAEAESDSDETLADRSQHLARQAKDAVQHSAEQAADAIRETYRGAQQAVKHRPMESVALTFAAGLVVGIGATLILRSR